MLAVGFGGLCQNHLPIDSITQKIVYKEVIKCDSLTAFGLYMRAKQWTQLHNDTAKTGEVPKFAVQRMQDDSSRIVAIGKFPIEYADYQQRVFLNVYYTLTLETKTGRTRIKFSELQHDDLSGIKGKPKPPRPFEETYFGLKDQSKPTKNAWLAYFTECDKVLRATIESYKKYVLSPPEQKVIRDDW
jgi:hypothetical protein